MRIKYIIIFIIFSISFIYSAANDINTAGMFAKFDEAYIAALSLTNQGDITASKIAVSALADKWKVLKNDLYKAYPSDKQWKNGLDKTGEVINKGLLMINKGNDLKNIHGTLESIRDILMKLRQDRKIEYYIDHLNRYHEIMESFLGITSGKTGETLTEEDVAKMGIKIRDLKDKWDILSSEKPDPAVFDLTNEKREKINEYKRSGALTIIEIGSAIQKKEKKEILRLSSKLKPEYSRLFMVFGKYPSKEEK
jgi:hypothetical protein